MFPAVLPAAERPHPEKLEPQLVTRVVTTIAEIREDAWDALFPAATEKYAFYKTVEESGFTDFVFRYVLVYDGEVLAGAAPCFLMNYSLDTTVQGFLKTWTNALRKIFPSALCLRVLVCGLPMGRGQVGARGDDPRVTRLACAAVEALARDEKASLVAYKDFDAEDTARFDFLRDEGFYRFENFPSMAMDLPFASFDAYTKTLSRASKEGLRRKLKNPNQNEIRLEVSASADHCLEELYALYLQTIRRHDELGFETVPKDFFRNISKNMPGETLFFLWWIGPRLAGFAYCLVSGHYFQDYYLGFDYALSHDYNLFFIRFRDLFNWCLAHGMTTYDIGNTNYESKRRLGFDFVRLFTYAKCRNRWINPVFHGLCHLLKPENFDPVFKIMRARAS
ncbi:MAG: GNAT family N-acetyltransferase [Candidatus Omnitrophota bacterium]